MKKNEIKNIKFFKALLLSNGTTWKIFWKNCINNGFVNHGGTLEKIARKQYSHALVTSFSWNKTVEGVIFWAKLNNIFQRLEINQK